MIVGPARNWTWECHSSNRPGYRMNSHLLGNLTWRWLFYRNFHATHSLNRVMYMYIWKEVSFLRKQRHLHWFSVIVLLKNSPISSLFSSMLILQTLFYESLWPSKPVKPTSREGRGKQSRFCEPLRLSCFFRKCCNKTIITGKKNNANFQHCELGSIFVFRYLDCDLHLFDLDELECKFDVVYIDPPLEEYQRRASGTTFNWKPWTWDEVCQ